MRRPALLLVSQLLVLGLGLLFPILFVRFNGHALFGEVALAATWSAAALSVLVTGFSQAILSDGLSLQRLRQLVCGLSLGGGAAWTIQAVALPVQGWAVYPAVAWVLATQSAVSFVYYYAVRRRRLAVMTFIMPAEALVRVAAVLGFAAAQLTGTVVLLGCFVISNLVVGLSGLALILVAAPAEDPDAAAMFDLRAVGRFMRWSISGVFVDAFDRSGYGALLPAATRSPFLFFDTLYMTGFGLVATTARLEVLAADTDRRLGGRRGLLLILGGGLAAAAIATGLLFAIAAPVARLTGFDPRPVAAAVLFAGAYRSALFVQFTAYAYIERRGRTEQNIAPRLMGSLVLAALIAASGTLPTIAVAVVATLVASIVALLSLRLALREPVGQA